MLTLTQVDLPQKLRGIPSPPKRLHLKGDARLLERQAIAIVGARKITPYGRQVTYNFAHELASRGLVIISGLALGVDAVAHQAALDAGGRTIAVLPSGLDKVYPASHHQLAKRIINTGGLLVSEYPEGTPPLRQHFIARNRLVSGLSDGGVVITEAANKSGTLHTANFALEQGREVFAIPGNITSAMSAGTNELIKTGAIPATSPQDILETLDIPDSEGEAVEEIIAATKEEHLILTLIRDGITDTSELIAHSKLTPDMFNQTLTMLEISGRIKAVSGQWNLLR